MALIHVPVQIDPSIVPDDVGQLVCDVETRITSYVSDRTKKPPFGFVPSDFRRVYAALHRIMNDHLSPGNAFLEWGSGFGLVAILATRLDFETYGIEIDPDLVAVSEALAEELEAPVSFARGSFIPEDGEALTDAVPDTNWLSSGRSAYPELGLEVDDFDVIFAYPWPGEEEVIADLFEHFAAPQALLVTYHGLDDVMVRRKV